MNSSIWCRNLTASEIEELSFPNFVTVLLRLNGATIVVLNSAVFAVLLVKRRRFSGSYWYQLVCLSANDALAGVGVLLMTTEMTQYARTNRQACSLAHVVNILAQIATLFNILGICIQRYLVVLRLGNPESNTWRSCYTVTQLILSWVISSLYCAVPFIIWTKSPCPLQTCSFETLFEDNYFKAVGFLFNGLVVPLILTNIIYIVVFIKLKKSIRQIQPHPDTNFGILGETGLNKFEPKSSETNKTPPLINSRNVTRKFSILAKNSLFAGNELCTDHGSSCTSNVSRQFPQTARANIGCSTSGVTSLVKSIDQISKRSFTLIGVVLIILNIVTWPAVIISILSLIPKLGISYGVKVSMLATITLNSLLNPIVYSLRVPEFQNALQELTSKLERRCCT